MGIRINPCFYFYFISNLFKLASAAAAFVLHKFQLMSYSHESIKVEMRLQSQLTFLRFSFILFFWKASFKLKANILKCTFLSFRSMNRRDQTPPSQNNRYMVNGKQGPTRAPAGGTSRFCVDCGTQFPVEWAKFCCLCGCRRT